MAICETAVSYRMSRADRLIFRELATRLQKKESEAVRLVVRETVAILREQDEPKQQDNPARRGRSRRG